MRRLKGAWRASRDCAWKSPLGGTLTASGFYNLDTQAYSFDARTDDFELRQLVLPNGMAVRGEVDLVASGSGTVRDPSGGGEGRDPGPHHRRQEDRRASRPRPAWPSRWPWSGRRRGSTTSPPRRESALTPPIRSPSKPLRAFRRRRAAGEPPGAHQRGRERRRHRLREPRAMEAGNGDAARRGPEPEMARSAHPRRWPAGGALHQRHVRTCSRPPSSSPRRRCTSRGNCRSNPPRARATWPSTAPSIWRRSPRSRPNCRPRAANLTSTRSCGGSLQYLCGRKPP